MSISCVRFGQSQVLSTDTARISRLTRSQEKTWVDIKGPRPAAAWRSRDLPRVACPPPGAVRHFPLLQWQSLKGQAEPWWRRWPPGASGSRPPPHQAATAGPGKRNSQIRSFAFKPFRTGAGVIPDAVFTVAVIPGTGGLHTGLHLQRKHLGPTLAASAQVRK